MGRDGESGEGDRVRMRVGEGDREREGERTERERGGKELFPCALTGVVARALLIVAFFSLDWCLYLIS